MRIFPYLMPGSLPGVAPRFTVRSGLGVPERAELDPESISPHLRGFDTWDDREILQALWQGQASALAAVHAILPDLARAARDIANRLGIGGRLIFVGAGTSQKVTLNLLSVLVMTRLGRVHDGLMVDLTPSRPKFRARAIRIVSTIAKVPEDTAERLLLQAGGHIKQAVLMGHGYSRQQSEAILCRNGDNLRSALVSLNDGAGPGPDS